MVGDDLLVVTESREAVLVEASPESAKFQVIEGKTWNHPVLNRVLLFVRNSKKQPATICVPPRLTSEELDCVIEELSSSMFHGIHFSTSLFSVVTLPAQ